MEGRKLKWVDRQKGVNKWETGIVEQDSNVVGWKESRVGGLGCFKCIYYRAIT